MNRLRCRVDGNQTAIIAALRAQGWSVLSLSTVGKGCPDLLVGVQGLNILLEVKMPKQKPSARQEQFKLFWNGQCAVVSSPEDAVKMVKLIISANWEQ